MGAVYYQIHTPWQWIVLKIICTHCIGYNQHFYATLLQSLKPIIHCICTTNSCMFNLLGPQDLTKLRILLVPINNTRMEILNVFAHQCWYLIHYVVLTIDIGMGGPSHIYLLLLSYLLFAFVVPSLSFTIFIIIWCLLLFDSWYATQVDRSDIGMCWCCGGQNAVSFFSVFPFGILLMLCINNTILFI